MATLKHINSKNADYGAAEQYLLFEHDEFTMKPVLDETGRLIPREDYRLSTLNCGGEDFAVACMRANLRYGKNQRREDVKSHHYIISFDPRDGPDNGLTVDRAQALGEKFCAEHFPGHQALVCTHPDGHNHSGNIHVHIVINSLRIEEVPFLPYMDRPADTKAGCKHRCTDAALRYFKSEVMEMNFIHATIEKKDQKYYVKFSDYSFEIPKGKGDAQTFEKYVGRPVVLGIRPEDILADEERVDAENKGMIQAKIDIVELMGAEVYIYLVCDGQRLVVRTPGGYHKKAGDATQFALNMDKIHLFDQETERAICH